MGRELPRSASPNLLLACEGERTVRPRQVGACLAWVPGVAAILVTGPSPGKTLPSPKMESTGLVSVSHSGT